METQTQMHRVGLDPFLTFYIDTMLNFDGDVDANANANVNVKCEHSLNVLLKGTGTMTFHAVIGFWTKYSEHNG